MTEIPEHLLKRSQERRAAIGGAAAPSSEPASAASDDSPSDTPAASPAVPTAAAAAVAAPTAPPPAPVRPEVAAALRRRKIPFWAMPVLAGLPLWAYVYQATLEPPPADESTPVALGEALYTSSACAGCHADDGSGGVGPALTSVLDVWPDYRDHMMWVRLGDPGWPGATYGATNKPKGQGMPSHPDLTDAQLAQVVLYERAAFGGLDPASEEYLVLVEIAEGRKTFAEAGLGPVSTSAGVDEAELASG
ncbi:MAG: c-type cytochrome [Microthrixaceae bacterium]